METTKLSSKGQVIITKAFRDAHHWGVGLELVVVDMGGGDEQFIKRAKKLSECVVERL